MKTFTPVFVSFFLFLSTNLVFSADDPTIKGDVRSKTQKAMSDHIKQNSLDGKYVIYDALSSELRTLDFKELHKGIVKKGDFYVSCADFVDDHGNKLDLDFFVVEKNGNFHVQQAFVHKINGEKRKYSLEK